MDDKHSPLPFFESLDTPRVSGPSALSVKSATVLSFIKALLFGRLAQKSPTASAAWLEYARGRYLSIAPDASIFLKNYAQYGLWSMPNPFPEGSDAYYDLHPQGVFLADLDFILACWLKKSDRASRLSQQDQLWLDTARVIVLEVMLSGNTDWYFWATSLHAHNRLLIARDLLKSTPSDCHDELFKQWLLSEWLNQAQTDSLRSAISKKEENITTQHR